MFFLVALEYWLGKTDRTKENSTLGIAIAILKRFLRRGK